MARRINEFRVCLILVLLRQEDSTSGSFRAGPVGYPEVAGVRRQRNTHPRDLASLRLGLDVVRRDDRDCAEAGEILIRDAVDELAAEPAEGVDVANAVVQADDIGVVAHPVEGVAILKCRGRGMQQAKVVPKLVDCHHDLEVVRDGLTAIAHGALLANPRHSLGASGLHLGRNDVDEVVVIEPVVGPRTLHGVPGCIIQGRKWHLAGCVTIPVSRVAGHLRHESDVQAELTIRHLLEKLVHLGKDLVLVVRNWIRILL
mmetsp:Transcript_62661/g.141390  ORF Transcript_62661/g.141390 Transcript_62661/m.141390 type:complete len:258 (+) Transcript_62661:1725-2498(+)